MTDGQETKRPIQPPDKPDPVARSIAKPDAFAKPAAIGKPGKATSQTRVRTMNFKRSRGRKRRPDLRKVKFW